MSRPWDVMTLWRFSPATRGLSLRDIFDGCGSALYCGFRMVTSTVSNSTESSKLHLMVTGRHVRGPLCFLGGLGEVRQSMMTGCSRYEVWWIILLLRAWALEISVANSVEYWTPDSEGVGPHGFEHHRQQNVTRLILFPRQRTSICYLQY